MARKCPKCGDANDFHIDNLYNVECGYCGASVGNVAASFKAARKAAKIEEAEIAKSRVDAEQKRKLACNNT